MTYYEELTRAMTWLGSLPNTIFRGQAVEYAGTGMTGTLSEVPKDKLVELPVAENMQLGMATGLAITGFLPIEIFPRWNFLLLAMDQLVNHLDKIPEMSCYGWYPRVIIRTAVGSVEPLDPQSQHRGDFSEALRKMLKTVEVVELLNKQMIFNSYQIACYSTTPTILVEFPDRYNT